MAKSSADDAELRRACQLAVEGTRHKVVFSIRTVKTHGTWGKSAKLGCQMAKPRVLALCSTRHFSLTLSPYSLSFYIWQSMPGIAFHTSRITESWRVLRSMVYLCFEFSSYAFRRSKHLKCSSCALRACFVSLRYLTRCFFGSYVLLAVV